MDTSTGSDTNDRVRCGPIVVVAMRHNGAKKVHEVVTLATEGFGLKLVVLL